MSVTVELSELDAFLWDAFRCGGEWVAASEYRKLMAQNARLREQSERLFDKTLELATENSKLRELCKLCEREAENDKLQNDADLLRAMLSQVQTEKRCYMAENAKLRELVKSMYYDLTHMTFPPDWVTDYKADLRDLGVEVDE